MPKEREDKKQMPGNAIGRKKFEDRNAKKNNKKKSSRQKLSAIYLSDDKIRMAEKKRW